jgi:di/tricarboxylate transporter
VLTILSFLFAGALSGVIITYSMDMKKPKEIVQGAVGGLIAGFLMAMMLPQ